MDHGRILALDTPGGLKRSVGADTVVTITADGDLDALADAARASVDGRHAAPRSSTASCCLRASGAGLLPRVLARRRAGRLHGHRPLDQRADARDRLHQPHREGPARMTTTHRRHPAPADVAAWPAPPGRGRLPAAFLRPARCATSTCCARASRLFVLRTIMQPLLLVFVFTYVFPKIGQGVGGAADGAAEFSTTLWSPASSARPSSSRASRPSRCRWCRSSATRRRSRTGCWRRCRRRLVGVQKIVDRRAQGSSPPSRLPDRRRRARHARCTCTSTGRAAHAGPAGGLGGRRARPRPRHQGAAPAGAAPVRAHRAAADVPRLRLLPVAGAGADPLAAVARARQPARLHVRGLPGRARRGRAAHEPLGGLRRA